MFGTTKTLLASMACLLAGTLLSAAPAAAQESQKVTGCLVKGPSDGTYDITAADGHEYMLTSDKVKLKDHVGHRVTVTGTPTEMGMAKDGMKHDGMAKDDMAKDDMAKDTGMAKEDGMAKDTGMQAMADKPMLKVGSMKMLGTDCK